MLRYSQTQLNIASTYTEIFNIENNRGIWEQILKICQDILNYIKRDVYPQEYAFTRFFQGQAYAHLADFVYLKRNCKKAIGPLSEALDFFTEKNIPFIHFTIFSIFGKIYWNLAKVEEKTRNCRKSKYNYEKALEFSSQERFPEFYNMIHINLDRLEDFCNQVDDE